MSLSPRKTVRLFWAEKRPLPDLEDGVPQTVSNFSVTQAPITAVLLTEFASTNYVFMIQALQASYAFANTLKKDDWVRWNTTT